MASKRFDMFFKSGHWLSLAALCTMVITGIRIRTSAGTDWFPWPFELSPQTLSGRVLVIHLATALAVAAGLVFLAQTFIRNNSKTGIKGRRLLNLLLLSALAFSAVTGFSLYKINMPAGLFLAVRFMHALSGFILIPLLLAVHVYLALVTYRMSLIRILISGSWLNMPGRLKYLFVPAAVVLLVLICAWVIPFKMTLDVAHTSLVSLEKAEQLDWENTDKLSMYLHNGVNFQGTGSTRLSVQGLHDEDNVLLRLTWTDAVEDTNYFPWIKEQNGWRRGVSDEEDENIYYEDKLGLTFPLVSTALDRFLGCALQCHLGTKPYGYKASPRMLDVWHWKRVRIQPAGQADDKYWFMDKPERKDRGRFGDPKQGGGYLKNKTKDGDRPLYISAGGNYNGACFLPASDTLALSAVPDSALPVGLRVPGVVNSPFLGDRGDISSRYLYAEGRYTLYLLRKMNTGSAYDVVFAPGRRVMFTVAAFDRASKRHAYNYRVYYMRLIP